MNSRTLLIGTLAVGAVAGALAVSTLDTSDADAAPANRVIEIVGDTSTWEQVCLRRVEVPAITYGPFEDGGFYTEPARTEVHADVTARALTADGGVGAQGSASYVLSGTEVDGISTLASQALTKWRKRHGLETE